MPSPAAGDHEGRPYYALHEALLRPVHSRGDPRGRPLRGTVLASLSHSPAESYDEAPLKLRYRRMSLLVELSCVSLGSSALSSSGMMRLASTFPSSTPHWSNESIFQMVPCTKTLCS